MIFIRMFGFLWCIGAAAIGAWFAVMALDNEAPFHYLSEAEGSHITPNPVHPEGKVSTHWILTEIKKDCPRQIERIYYNRDTGELVTTQDATPLSQVTKGSPTKLSRSFDLPPGLPTRSDYQAKACFQCNFLQMFFPLCAVSPKLSINILE